MRRDSVRMVVLGSLLYGLWAAPGSANPSSQNPQAPLAVRSDNPVAQELHRMAVEILETLGPGVEQMATTLDSDAKVNQLSPLKVGQLFAGTVSLAWCGERLQLEGEPAGTDFILRSNEYSTTLRAIIDRYISLPGNKAKFTTAVLGNVAKKNEKRLESLRQLAEKEQWDQADLAMIQLRAELVTYGVWYESKDFDRIFKAYLDVFRAVTPPILNARRTRAAEQLAARRAELAPDFAGLLEQLDKAAAQASQGGGLEWDGTARRPGEWLAEFLAAWRQAQLHAQRCRGLDLARLQSDQQAAGADLRQLVNDQQQTAARLVPGVGKFVAGVADGTTAAAAAQTYHELLAVLGEQAAALGEGIVAEAEPHLMRLAEKSPPLGADAAAYQAATDEWLRWRGRLVQAYAKRYEDKHQPPHLLLHTHREAQLFGTQRTPVQAELRLAAPVLLQHLQPALDGKSPVVVVEALRRDDGTGPLTSPSYAGVYVRWESPAALAEAADRVAAALAADAQHAPLSLAAAVAVASSRRGENMAFGGTLSGLTLQGLPPRSAELSPDDWGLVRYDALDASASGVRPADAVRQLLVQADFEPAWARHSCFFLRLRADQAAVANAAEARSGAVAGQ